MLDFYNCTNITITLFDNNLNYITDVGDWQPYCMAIGNNPDSLAECERCNRENLQNAHNRHDSIVYTCHAGIVESVTPIFFEDNIIAYLMLGKFRDAEEKYSSAEFINIVAEKYGLDKDIMLDAYNALPVFTESYIDSAISILKVCICFMVNENFIYFDRRMLSMQIEQYIDEHLNEKITVDELCKKFHVARHILYAIFKTDFNDQIQNYILKKRFHKAKNLLVTTQKPIHEIATECGFTDYNYFIQFFKKKTGIPPLQYRKNNNIQ